jgi:hypothetical protein
MFETTHARRMTLETETIETLIRVQAIHHSLMTVAMHGTRGHLSHHHLWRIRVIRYQQKSLGDHQIWIGDAIWIAEREVMTVNAVTITVKETCGRLRWTSEIPEVLRRLRRLAHSLLGAPMFQTAIVRLLADPLYQPEFLRGAQTSLPRLH